VLAAPAPMTDIRMQIRIIGRAAPPQRDGSRNLQSAVFRAREQPRRVALIIRTCIRCR